MLEPLKLLFTPYVNEVKHYTNFLWLDIQLFSAFPVLSAQDMEPS